MTEPVGQSRPFRTAPMKDGIRYDAKGEPMTEPVGQSPEERDWKWGDDPATLAAATVQPPGDEAGLRAALERALGSLPEESIRHEYEPGSTEPTLFVEWDALLAALAAKPDRNEEEPGLDEEHCCNDPAHMSPEYLARLANPATGS